MTTINLTPEPGDELVRLKNNARLRRSKSWDARVFRPDHRQAFWIPTKDVVAVLSEPLRDFISPRCPNGRRFRT